MPEDESPEKGASAPSGSPTAEKKKGEASPRLPAGAKEEVVERSRGEARPSRGATVEEAGVSPSGRRIQEKRSERPRE